MEVRVPRLAVRASKLVVLMLSSFTSTVPPENSSIMVGPCMAVSPVSGSVAVRASTYLFMGVPSVWPLLTRLVASRKPVARLRDCRVCWADM